MFDYTPVPEDQIRQFDEEGYLVVRDVLDDASIAELLEASDRLIASDSQTSRQSNPTGLYDGFRNSIALDDATPENGCIKVIPCSHHWGLQEWGHIAQDRDAPLTTRDDINPSASIDVPLRSGSAILFHSLMVHGSGPNQTNRSRNTALYAYFSPHVRYVPGDGAVREKAFPVVAGLEGAQEHTLVAP